MKRIVLLSLLSFPIFLFAQYPTFSNKQKLGVQTTGDGLIYRGRNNPNYYTPSNINNAYFYLDTLTSKLYLYNISDWQQIYPTTSDTTSLGNFLLKSDTLAMLLPYLRKADTISLSNRINNKLNATDTVSLSNRINLKLNQTDTINLSNRIDLKLNKSDTISLSNRINTKLNTSDTVSLSNRINKKLDTIYIQYPSYIDTILNKDTINISNTLTEGFGINIIADSINIDSAIILATQQKQIAYVKNQSGVTMYKGQAVYSSGSTGDNKLVTLASSNTEQTSSKTFGVVESDSIPNGSQGYIITFGLLSGLNTDNLTEGSSIYLSTTPGQLTTTKPQAPLHLVTIGICIRRQQNNGSIFVKIQNGFELDEIHDVRITSPVNNASLYYSNGLWRDTTATLLVSDTASMLSKYVNTYSNQTNINGEKSFNNTINIPSYNLGTFTSEKSFNVLFNNDANQKVRLYFPANSRLQGGYEITISSGYYYVQASGMLRKSYGVQLQENGTLYIQSTHVPYVLGAIGNHFTISDFEYDSQTNTWGVIIACLSSNASNYVHINIKSYINPENLNTWLNARASAANITNIYTTNTTVYPNLNPTNLSKSDTASMLLPYVNTYGNQININGNKTFNNIVTIDSLVANRLDVNSPVSSSVKINSNTYSTEIELMNSGGKSYIKSNNKNITLQTDTTALVYLKGDDNRVGILTMSPQQALQVAGNVRIDSLNNNLIPSRIVGSNNNNDLTNINLGQGLSFTNDTLKVDLTIIDTAIAASSITLAGHVTGTGSTNSTVNTTISNGVVTNDMLAGGISDNKLNTITTTGKVDNSATTATSSNNPNTIVLRDASRNFTANNITANNFYGLASTSTIANSIQSNNTTGIIKLTTSSNAVLPILTVPDVNATIATTNLNQTFDGTQTFTNTIIGNISGNAATVTSVVPSNFANQSANTVLAAPNGSSGTPSFRSLVSSDIPSLNYLPLTGGTTSGLITSSFTNTSNYSTSATDNNAFTVYNNTTSSNNIYGGIQFLIGQNSGVIPGGPGLAQIYAIRAGGVSDPSTDLSFITKGSSTLERLRIKFDGKVGIGTSTPSYLLDVNGQIGSTGFIKSGGTSSQFLKADGSVDANTYLTTGTAASTYLPLTGGTITNDLTVNNIFKAKDFGNHTFVNYIQNGDFDLTSTIDASAFNYGYPYYVPLHWKSAATLRYVSYWSSTGGYNSPGSFRQYDSDASTGGALYQDVTNWQDLKGKTVTACGWFTKGTLINTGNHAEIQINDGLTTTTTSIGTTTTWQRACVTKTISASATRVRVIVGCNLAVSGEGGAVSDIDAISLVIGEGKHQFSPKPLFDRDTQRLSGTLLIGYDSENNLAYNPSATSNLKVAGSTSLNGTLGVNGVTTLSNLSGGSTRMVTASSTGVLSTQAIPTGTLVGTDTVSLSNRINGKVSLTGNEYINGAKTFGGLLVPTNGMQLTATGNNSIKLIGLNTSSFVGEVTLGSGLTLTNNVLNTTNASSGGFVTTNSNYTVTITDTWIVFNNNFSNITVTLPDATTSLGRTLYFRNTAAGSIVSAGTANVINNTVTTGTPTNDILGAGNTSVKWCTLVSNGTYWIKMQAGSL